MSNIQYATYNSTHHVQFSARSTIPWAMNNNRLRIARSKCARDNSCGNFEECAQLGFVRGDRRGHHRVNTLARDHHGCVYVCIRIRTCFIYEGNVNARAREVKYETRACSWCARILIVASRCSQASRYIVRLWWNSKCSALVPLFTRTNLWKGNISSDAFPFFFSPPSPCSRHHGSCSASRGLDRSTIKQCYPRNTFVNSPNVFIFLPRVRCATSTTEPWGSLSNLGAIVLGDRVISTTSFP